jgi:hypothetical protein
VLATVLDKKPNIVGLQEWGDSRDGVLLRTSLRAGYSFVSPKNGGPPVGILDSWGEWLTVRKIPLAPKGDANRATYGVEGIARQYGTGRIRVVLNIHLLAHHDDPAQLRAWRIGRSSVIEWAKGWEGYSRFVLGDGNKHLMQLPPLVSCWDGHRAEPTGPHGGTIDAIWANRAAKAVDAYRTRSDHKFVVADY